MNVLLLSKSKNHALNILRCLAGTGVNIHVLGFGEAEEVRLSKHCCEYVRCDTPTHKNFSPQLIETINRYCLRKNISCVMPTDYDATLFLSKAQGSFAEHVRTICLSTPQTLQALNNKWRFTQLLGELHLPHPRSFVVKNIHELALINLPFPRVVKPLRGGGRWNARSIVPGSYIKETEADYLASGSDEKEFPLLVQEFIQGIDACLSVFAVQGRIVASSMQKSIGSDRLQFFESAELFDLGERLIARTNFQGPVNFDLRIDQRDGSFKFIECNPRFWGSLRASRWNGINFPMIAVNLALNKDILQYNQPKNVEYVFPSIALRRLSEGDLTVLWGLPESTRRDLCQIAGDPVSCLYSLLHRRR